MCPQSPIWLCCLLANATSNFTSSQQHIHVSDICQNIVTFCCVNTSCKTKDSLEVEVILSQYHMDLSIIPNISDILVFTQQCFSFIFFPIC